MIRATRDLRRARASGRHARAPSFSRYLATNCAWDDELERAAAMGKRSFADMQPMWACRTRNTQAAARKALAAAR
jgi:hypothetical protein